MIYNITTNIYGNRSVFGYGNSGAGTSSGNSSAKDVYDILNEEFREHDWSYIKWDGDVLTVDFESKRQNNQFISTYTLQPETYSEFLILKKWEQENGFLQG